MRRGPVIESPAGEPLPLGMVASLLDLLDQPILVSDRTGRILLANSLGTQRLAAQGLTLEPNTNLFSDLLQIAPQVIV